MKWSKARCVVTILAGLVPWMVMVLVPASSFAEVPQDLLEHPFYVAKTKHFWIINGTRQGYGQDVGKKLEQTAAVLTRRHPGFRVKPPLPTIVFLLDEKQFDYYTQAPKKVLAYFLDAGDRLFIVVNADDERARGQVLTHEFVHLFVRANLPGLPVWLNEGLAEFYATLRVRGRRAEFGHRRDGWLRVLGKEQTLSMDLLFATTIGSHAYTHGEQFSTRFYAQSWVLTHYLFDDPDRAAKLTTVLGKVHDGARARTVFESEFPESVDGELVDELDRYIKRDWFEPSSFELGDLLEIPRPRAKTLSRTETMRNLAAILEANGRIDDAREHYEASLTASPSNTLALAQLGVLEDVAGSPDVAEAHYGQALSKAPDRTDVLASVALGTLFRGFVAKSEDEKVGAFELARERLRLSLEADPKNLIVRAGYGQSYDASDSPPSDAVAALESAFDELPYKVDVGMSLLRLYVASGERSKAEALLENRLRAITDPRQYERALEAVAGISEHAAEPSDARSSEPASDGTVPSRRGGSFESRGALFGEASEAAKRGELERAKELFQQLRASAQSEQEIETLDEILRDLDARIALRKGMELMKAGRSKAAHDLLENMDDKILDDSMRSARLEMMAYCRMDVAIAASYELVRQGKLEEARARLQAVDTEHLSEQNRALLKKRIRELSEAIAGE